MERLGVADFAQRLGWQMIQLLQDFGDQRPYVFHPIALGQHDHDGDWKRRQILLKLDISICRQEDIELRGSKRQQLSILDAGPTALRYGCRFMPYEHCSKPSRN